MRPPISKIATAKMDWRCRPIGRMPALQTQSPEFKPQSHPKNEKVMPRRAEKAIFAQGAVE
jgi:hypothetical protein